jgi:hypothetical protein
MTELLDAAWKSGKGRNDASLEGYLALAQIVPWSYSTYLATNQSREQTKKSFHERFTSMRAAAEEAAKVEPRFEALVLFMDVLQVGFDAQVEAAPGARLAPKTGALDDLVKRATALGKKTPNEMYVQGAVLAVAGLLARDRDVQSLLELLPRDLDVSHELPFHELRAWNALYRRDAGKLSAVSNDLGAFLGELAPDSLDRARILLTLAETDASLNQSSKAYTRLEQVAKPLLAAGVPLAIRLRAAIDVAGARARAGDSAGARAALTRVLQDMKASSGSDDERHLALVAESYSFALEAREKKKEERQKLRERFKLIGEEANAAGAPPAIHVWRELWLRELDFLIAEERCAGAPVCVARAEKARKLPAKDIDERAGAVAGELIRNGALATGTYFISFSFEPGHVAPVVVLQPAFLAVETPGYSSKKSAK